MKSILGKQAPYIVLALSAVMGMPETIRFNMDGDPHQLWLCALWGLVAGGAVSVILLKLRRERRSSRTYY